MAEDVLRADDARQLARQAGREGVVVVADMAWPRLASIPRMDRLEKEDILPRIPGPSTGRKATGSPGSTSLPRARPRSRGPGRVDRNADRDEFEDGEVILAGDAPASHPGVDPVSLDPRQAVMPSHAAHPAFEEGRIDRHAIIEDATERMVERDLLPVERGTPAVPGRIDFLVSEIIRRAAVVGWPPLEVEAEVDPDAGELGVAPGLCPEPAGELAGPEVAGPNVL